MLTEFSPTYSPLRPPSIPLAVRSPYTSTWSTTGNGSTLNSRNVTFWNSNALGWSGIVRVDGTAYEYMGDSPSVLNLTKATPLTVSYDSHYSNFTFDARPGRVTARFFSPVLPKDLCSSSIPMSYLEVAYEAADGIAHDVQLYSDVNAMWLAEGNLPVRWKIDCLGGCSSDAANCSCPSLAMTASNRIQGRQRSRSQPRGRKEDDGTNYTGENNTICLLLVLPHMKLSTIGSGSLTMVSCTVASIKTSLDDVNNMISKHYQAFAATAEAAARWIHQLREAVASYYADERDEESGAPDTSSSTVPDVLDKESYYAILALSGR
jgi:hypothetical protein